MKRNKVFVTTLFLVGVILVLTIIISANTVMANDGSSRQKQITTVQIQEGDSLWSIASQYYTNEYSNMNSYIKEIKKVNKLSSDTIHEDCYLVIPYYE